MRAAIIPLVLTLALMASGCATVRQVQDPASISPDGTAAKIEEDKALAFSVATTIDAPAATVWEVLTDVEDFPRWNSTIISMEGAIALGETVSLVSTTDPERTFKLEVSEFEPTTHMVWEDGMPMGMFSGVRTYTLIPQEGGGTVFVMEEVLSGGMLGMISKSLPDFRPGFEAYAADLKAESEARAQK